MRLKDFLLSSISEFLRRSRMVLKDRSGEGCLGDIIPGCDKAEEFRILVIDGIKYIVSSHFKQDGKDAVESAYRLIERESEPA